MADRDSVNGALPVLPASNGSAHAPSQTLRYQLRVLRRRWWLVALVTLAVVGGAWWRSQGQVPHYSAIAHMQKQPDRDLLEAGWAGFYDLTPEAINAQIEIIKGQDVLHQVIDSVGARIAFTDPGIFRDKVLDYVKITPDAPAAFYSLRRSGNEFQLVDARNALINRTPVGGILLGRGFALRPAARFAPVSPVAFRIMPRDEALDALKEGLHVQQMKGSMILEVKYTSPDPIYARDVANSIGQAYSWYTGRRSRLAAGRRKEALAERLSQLSDSLLSAQQQVHEVDQLQASSGVGPNENAVSAELVEARTRLRDLKFRRSELIDLNSKLAKDLEQGVNSALALTELLPGVNVQYEAIANLQRDRLELRRTRGFAEKAPEVQAIDAAITEKRKEVQRLAAAQVAAVNGQVANAEQHLRELQSDFAALSSHAAETEAVRSQADAIQRVLDNLTEKYFEAQINERIDNGAVDIISSAVTPKVPDGTRNTRSFLFATLVGLMLGALAAFVLEHLDTRVRDVDDAQRAAAIGVIGLIPELRSDGGRPLAINSEDHSVGAEAYRKLRTNLRFLRATRPRVIAVTSPGPDEGKSVTAANLALAIAQQGQDVLLIDGDLRRPVQHEIFGANRGPGLSDALVGLIDPLEAVQPFIDAPNLSVLACGTEAPNPAELLGSDAFGRLLGTFAQRFDTIVVDTPPVNLVTDAAVIGSVTDGVLLVAEAGRTDRSVLASAVNELRQARGSVLGIVLNRIARSGRQGGYYNGRAYQRKQQKRNGNGDRRSIREWVSTRV